MTTLTEDKTRRARKIHKCYFCGEPIDAGTEYVERKGVEDGEWWTMRAHAECVEAATDWLDYDYETFEPGSMKRGLNEGR